MPTGSVYPGLISFNNFYVKDNTGTLRLVYAKWCKDTNGWNISAFRTNLVIFSPGSLFFRRI